MFLNFWFSALNAKFKKGLIKYKYFFQTKPLLYLWMPDGIRCYC